MNSTNASKRPVIRRFGRTSTRATALVVVAGLAAGGAFAAVTGISSASSTTTSTTAKSTTPTPSADGHGWGGRGDFGPGRGFGGAGGTITAINGSTLTLRTENGTETVKTTSSTTYTKEEASITFSELRVGDIVHVGALRVADAASTPGTGTVTATRVEVVLPELRGRVTAIAGGVYTLVGPDGQILTVSSTGATSYYNGTTKTTAATVKVGTHIVAEGTQDSLTHLSADTIAVEPTDGPASGMAGGFGGHGDFGRGPGGYGGTWPTGQPA